MPANELVTYTESTASAVESLVLHLHGNSKVDFTREEWALFRVVASQIIDEAVERGAAAQVHRRHEVDPVSTVRASGGLRQAARREGHSCVGDPSGVAQGLIEARRVRLGWRRMSDEIIKPPSAEIEQLVARAAYYGKSTITDHSRRTYDAEFRHFKEWAQSRGLWSMPPEVATVAVYLAALADGMVEVTYQDQWGHTFKSKKPHKYGSVMKNYTSIIFHIRAAGHEWPEKIDAITKVMHGIRYRNGDKKRRMAPLEVADLRLCIMKTKERRFEDLTVIRDRAMLSLGFFAALRRSELVAVRVEDLDFQTEGLVLTIRRSKTDQFQEGEQLGITPQKDKNICPIALLKRYLEVSEIKTGPVFRRIDSRSDCYGNRALTPKVVAFIVKQYAERAGLDPERFAGHSLRAGFATTASFKGRSLPAIMRQGRWKDQRTAMTYIRAATVFRDNPTSGLSDDEEPK